MQGDDTLAPIHNLPTFYIGNINTSNKKGSFTIKKQARHRQYPMKTIINADYLDNLMPLANIPAQAESLQHRLEQAASGIGHYVNSNKKEFICFNEDGAISSLNDKLVDQFIYFGSKISSTESNVNILTGN